MNSARLAAVTSCTEAEIGATAHTGVFTCSVHLCGLWRWWAVYKLELCHLLTQRWHQFASLSPRFLPCIKEATKPCALLQCGASLRCGGLAVMLGPKTTLPGTILLLLSWLQLYPAWHRHPRHILYQSTIYQFITLTLSPTKHVTKESLHHIQVYLFSKSKARSPSKQKQTLATTWFLRTPPA